MIHDVDACLRELLERDALGGADVDIAFDAPSRDWAARQSAPVIDVYLYDIREDLSRREMVFEEIRDDAGLVVERRRPPRRFKLSYLVTAWTQRPEDEHRLLSAVLACFLRHETVPDDILTGSLAAFTQPTILQVALPPPQDRTISDVWSALGGELKPSLDLVVICPIDGGTVVDIAPPVTAPPRIGLSEPGGARDDGVRPHHQTPAAADAPPGDAPADAPPDDQPPRRRTRRA